MTSLICLVIILKNELEIKHKTFSLLFSYNLRNEPENT